MLNAELDNRGSRRGRLARFVFVLSIGALLMPVQSAQIANGSEISVTADRKTSDRLLPEENDEEIQNLSVRVAESSNQASTDPVQNLATQDSSQPATDIWSDIEELTGEDVRYLGKYATAGATVHSDSVEVSLGSGPFSAVEPKNARVHNTVSNILKHARKCVTIDLAGGEFCIPDDLPVGSSPQPEEEKSSDGVTLEMSRYNHCWPPHGWQLWLDEMADWYSRWYNAGNRVYHRDGSQTWNELQVHVFWINWYDHCQAANYQTYEGTRTFREKYYYEYRYRECWTFANRPSSKSCQTPGAWSKAYVYLTDRHAECDHPTRKDCK